MWAIPTRCCTLKKSMLWMPSFGFLRKVRPAPLSLRPDIRTPVEECYIAVELGGTYCYGQMIFDCKNHLKRSPNGAVCTQIELPLYKKHVKELLI